MALTVEDARRLARETKAWLETPEGLHALREAVEKSAQDLRRLREARRLTYEDLHTPFDI